MSTPQPDHIDVPVYLLIEPKWARWRDAQGRPVLEGGRVTRATVKRPAVGRDGGVVTRLTLRIDTGVFLPLQPEAVVHVHAGNAETIEVEAIAPREESDDA